MATKENGSVVPGIIGWGSMVAFAVVFDVVAARKGHLTLSRTLGKSLSHPVLGPVLAGAFCGLGYHLYIGELVPDIVDMTTTATKLTKEQR